MSQGTDKRPDFRRNHWDEPQRVRLSKRERRIADAIRNRALSELKADPALFRDVDRVVLERFNNVPEREQRQTLEKLAAWRRAEGRAA